MDLYWLLNPYLIWPIVIVCFGIRIYFLLNRGKVFHRGEIVKKRFRKDKRYEVESRGEQFDRLEKDEEFDMIIVGGGATGTGIALDACSRGLKVALFEMHDFSSGTSSRTTKLAHGGVRYLQKAIKKMDTKEFEFVYDSLRERKHFFQISPHLCSPLKIVTPCFSWIDAIKNYLLLKLYDVFGGVHRSVGPSEWLSRRATQKLIPAVKAFKLKGSVVYRDCQFNDARFNVLLALTANALGGVALNHTEVVGLLKSEAGKVCGVEIVDALTEKKLSVRGKCVINACGYMVDKVRMMDDPEVPKIISPSLGVHVVIDGKYAPPGAGVLVPVTTDKRVLFILNYEDKCIVGTTEGPADLEPHPGPVKESIDMILKNMNMVFEEEITKEDIISSWAGVRPLVKDPSVKNTAGLSRDHYIASSKSGLITICGGKYTTFRRMSHDLVEKAVKLAGLEPERESQSIKTVLIGSETITSNRKLRQKFAKREQNFEKEVAEHLVHFYGDKAFEVAQIAREENLSERLHPDYPLLEAEVVYQCRYELAAKLTDVLAARSSIMFLDVNACMEMVPRIVELMAAELGWDEERIEKEKMECRAHVKKCTALIE